MMQKIQRITTFSDTLKNFFARLNDEFDNIVFNWNAAVGTGLLQTVSAKTTTGTNVTSSTFTVTALTATITPTYTTSKILINVSGNFHVVDANATNAYVTIKRGTTNLAGANGFCGISNGTVASQVGVPLAITYLDAHIMNILKDKRMKKKLKWFNKIV